MGAHLVFFQKRRFNGFIFKILSDKSLGRKVCVFFQVPWDKQNPSEFSDFLFIFMLPFP